MSSLFQSLQVRLIFAFVLVTAVALAIAAGVFVAARKEDQERQQLDRLAAVSPLVATEYFTALTSSEGRFDLEEFAHEAAARHDVRVLLFGPGEVVSADSDEGLVGEAIEFPASGTLRGRFAGRPYHAFRTEGSSATEGLVFIESPALQSADSPRRAPDEASAPEQRVVLAVPESTITRAWLDLMPALGVAAAVAFPVAVLLAVLLARSIARPVHQLTVASQRLSEGSFDIDVQTGRQDEIGRLSDAFATMAGRVGTTQSQMRQLVANVSHDLKTPLTSILGFARALSSGAAVDEAEARHMGAVIEEEAGRLSARLNDLLYLSEMDAGRALVDWADVDVPRLIESVVERVVPPGDARWRAAELEVGLVAPADGPKLERVVENMLSNAVKFTPDDGEIRVRAFSEGGAARAVVEVANTAPGTEQADLPRLFERFYRGDRTRAATSGSGLGLAIARDLARLMGGELEARLEGRMLVMRLGLRAMPDAVH